MDYNKFADIEVFAKNKEELKDKLPEEIYNLYDNLCIILKHESIKTIIKEFIKENKQYLLAYLEEMKNDNKSCFVSELIMEKKKKNEIIDKMEEQIKDTNNDEQLAEYILVELTKIKDSIVADAELVEICRQQIESEGKERLFKVKFNGENLVNREEGIGRIINIELNYPIIIDLYNYIINNSKILEEREENIKKLENDTHYTNYKEILENIEEIIYFKIRKVYLSKIKQNTKEIESLENDNKLKYIINIKNRKTKAKDKKEENETYKKIREIAKNKFTKSYTELIQIETLYDTYYEPDFSQIKMTGSDEKKIEILINIIIKKEKERIEKDLLDIEQKRITNRDRAELKKLSLEVNGKTTLMAKHDFLLSTCLLYVFTLAIQEQSKNCTYEEAREILNQICTEEEQNDLLNELNSIQNNYYLEQGYKVKLQNNQSPNNQISKGYQKTLKMLPPNKK